MYSFCSNLFTDKPKECNSTWDTMVSLLKLGSNITGVTLGGAALGIATYNILTGNESEYTYAYAGAGGVSFVSGMWELFLEGAGKCLQSCETDDDGDSETFSTQQKVANCTENLKLVANVGEVLTGGAEVLVGVGLKQIPGVDSKVSDAFIATGVASVGYGFFNGMTNAVSRCCTSSSNARGNTGYEDLDESNSSSNGIN